MGVLERPQAVRAFATTQWSVVAAAGRGGSPDARDALATLCQDYWFPLYAYVRRRGYDTHEAQDLTQAFFAAILEKNTLKTAHQGRGKFRSFLLASLKHFVANQWRHAGAQKRGGRQLPLSLDFDGGERRYGREPSHNLTPQAEFERKWAMALLEQTLARLHSEYASADKLELFDHLKPYLGRERDSVPYCQIASELGMTEGAVKVAVHRLRRRCRELLRAEIAQTVTGPAELEDELRDLFDAVARPGL